MQDADDEDLPPLEEDVDEGSRMEVICCAPCSVYQHRRTHECSPGEWLIVKEAWHRLLPQPRITEGCAWLVQEVD